MVAMSQTGGGFEAVDKCTSAGRAGHTVVADMDGTLLRGSNAFPYYALVAFDVGGVLRLAFLLLVAPLAGALYYLVSESAGIRVLVFAAMAGARVADVESAARAVLPKFYAADVHPESWRVFSACGRRCVITASPRIMVEAFLKEYMGADVVIGTEIAACGGRATGFVRTPGVLVGAKKAAALRDAFGEVSPEIGLGDRKTDFPFMRLCKEAYIVPANPKPEAVPGNKLRKHVVFHDGRLVQPPSPLLALLTVLWFPAGIILAFLRIAVGNLLPLRYIALGLRVLGVRIIVKGTPPPPVRSSGSDRSGVLFVCAHRTLMDPVFLALSICRPVSAVTYSVSRLTEIISPIRTFPLNRDRVRDAAMIKRLLQEGDLVICPEGTTCREPFLLRFSALFAELSDRLVPVAMESKTSMFHGTTARGRKWMDAIYFFMNPCPAYEVTFLDELPREMTCGAGGRPSQEVANNVQTLIATALGYQCTMLTRKDKYMAMAGNNGVVAEKKTKVVKVSKLADELLKALY